ncbi:MAG: hypothetical protein P1V97_24400 [Planctomycetota bacterium]|nr:hypothetical protein [Planctomycetota bacterium]
MNPRIFILLLPTFIFLSACKPIQAREFDTRKTLNNAEEGIVTGRIQSLVFGREAKNWTDYVAGYSGQTDRFSYFIELKGEQEYFFHVPKDGVFAVIVKPGYYEIKSHFYGCNESGDPFRSVTITPLGSAIRDSKGRTAVLSYNGLDSSKKSINVKAGKAHLLGNHIFNVKGRIDKTSGAAILDVERTQGDFAVFIKRLKSKHPDLPFN